MICRRTEDIDIIHSPLSQTYSADSQSLRVLIYRLPDTQWSLEVVDEAGTSTVWDDLFETDKQVLEEAFMAIESEGIGSFISKAHHEDKTAEPALLKALAQGKIQPTVQEVQDMMAPLSDADLAELDQFLLDGVDNDEAMTLDTLDGYLHAIAIGPQTIMPSQWLPKVWGEDSAVMPPMDNLEQFNNIMGLVMRHYNSIISAFQHKPPFVAPYWGIRKYETGVYEDAEGWAYGFTEGVALNRAAWKPLFDTAQGQQWYRPIGLLGEEAFSAEQDELTKTPPQREQLAQQIENSLVNIHAFWLPLRQAMYERETSQRLRTKVGRNEPCPCGSGKKFKKCCGSAAELH
ncbi:UPF0149 family protein [Limnohabitans planktonicus]|uniref:UPF0149 family protein n=1 Tax=Limnohabitans planktonicus TaxID=540060 RepID=UPI001057FDB1|nr:UPF0149 family protein [Limnohabitans planktonicus]|eukprot:gene12097-14016_t